MGFVRSLMEWIGDHEVLFGSLVTLSVIVFLGTLFLVPWVLVRLPPDYFRLDRERRVPMEAWHPAVRGILLVGKNLLGGLFVLIGIAMLVLPGQGLLTILIGLLLLNFPGKYKVERYIVTRKPVLQSINWLRKRARRPSLQLD